MYLKIFIFKRFSLTDRNNTGQVKIGSTYNILNIYTIHKKLSQLSNVLPQRQEQYEIGITLAFKAMIIFEIEGGAKYKF